jgi:hypothetical protein
MPKNGAVAKTHRIHHDGSDVVLQAPCQCIGFVKSPFISMTWSADAGRSRDRAMLRAASGVVNPDERSVRFSNR